MDGVWLLIALLAAGGALLLVRALRDVRHEIAHTVDSFTRFRSALAPALVELRDETRGVTLRRESPAPPLGAAPGSALRARSALRSPAPGADTTRR